MINNMINNAGSSSIIKCKYIHTYTAANQPDAGAANETITSVANSIRYILLFLELGNKLFTQT